MKKDIEKYINNSINAETPQSLSKDNIVRMLDASSQEPKLTKRKRQQTVYKFAAAAAAIALILSAVTIYGSVKKPKAPTVTDNGTVSVSADENYDAIYAKLKEMKASFNSESSGLPAGYYNVVYGAMPEGTIDNMINKDEIRETTDSTAQNSYGTTNTQEENIDEGDIIKTDGKCIYLADRNSKRVHVVKADGGQMSKLSEIKLSGDVHIEEMYLTGSTLALVYSEYDYSRNPTSYNADAAYNSVYCGCCAVWVYTDTKTAFYDISDPQKVNLISEYSQSGNFTSSRLVDGKLYMVSSYGVNLFSPEYKDTCIPETAENGVKERIPASKITLVNGTQTPAYAVICTYDVKSGKKTDSSAIFGNPTHVYATENSFYLAETGYDSEKCDSYLNILKFEFTDTGVKYLASAKAEGNINSNLSMNEYKGFFRVATTCNTVGNNGARTFTQINKLYIFDSELKQTGLIDGFAKNEEIRSARYVGDYAYVVTFQRTDPLFVINLSDPKNPKIESELKLPGFSSYLHPVGEGLLVGVGRDGDENNSNNNMKVSLFSVADPKNPKELSSVKVADKNDYVQSDVFFSYKAFVNLPDGEFAVPLSVNYSRNQMFIRYRVSDGALSEVARLQLGGEATEIVGGTYIGNYFYAFSLEFVDGKTSDDTKWNGKLTSFDLTSNAQIQEIRL